MGPNCDFCQTGCFVRFPKDTPEQILQAYGDRETIPTCKLGQEFEKVKVGYCYDDIMVLLGGKEQGMANKAFDRAKLEGRLSDDPAAPNYVGRYMYMGAREGRDLFKNSDTREYDV